MGFEFTGPFAPGPAFSADGLSQSTWAANDGSAAALLILRLVNFAVPPATTYKR